LLAANEQDFHTLSFYTTDSAANDEAIKNILKKLKKAAPEFYEKYSEFCKLLTDLNAVKLTSGNTTSYTKFATAAGLK
jgi:D-ribose pyranose/furanose isomerase RbsD